jgi:hypothetical protein
MVRWGAGTKPLELELVPLLLPELLAAELVAPEELPVVAAEPELLELELEFELEPELELLLPGEPEQPASARADATAKPGARLIPRT